MTLNFFYMVRDEGSWLDIGTTISHFCIASGLCTFVAGLEFLSETLIAGVKFEDDGVSKDAIAAGGESDHSKSGPAKTDETQRKTMTGKEGKAPAEFNGTKILSPLIR